MSQQDIIVTWPKTRSLDSYLEALIEAEKNREVICFRVPTLPSWDGLITDHGVSGFIYGARRPRCYRVHDGAIRGWTWILDAEYRSDDTVQVVGTEDQYWAAGNYIICDPRWISIEPTPMKGFRGWRWLGGSPHLRRG